MLKVPVSAEIGGYLVDKKFQVDEKKRNNGLVNELTIF